MANLQMQNDTKVIKFQIHITKDTEILKVNAFNSEKYENQRFR
jgi:hypothetical protein